MSEYPNKNEDVIARRRSPEGAEAISDGFGDCFAHSLRSGLAMTVVLYKKNQRIQKTPMTAAHSNESMRSNVPPWPGITAPESLMPP